MKRLITLIALLIACPAMLLAQPTTLQSAQPASQPTEQHTQPLLRSPATSAPIAAAREERDAKESTVSSAATEGMTIPSNQPTQIIIAPAPPGSPVAAYTTVAVAIISLAGLFVTAWYYRRLIKQQDVEAQIDHTQKLLDTFYGPLRTLKQANRHLHDMFKLTQREDGTVESESYAALEALLAGREFSPNQRALMAAIIKNNSELDKLISANCGAIESEDLQDKVHKFCAHHHVIEAAFKGEISGEFWRFKKFVYPRGLDEAIAREIERLQRLLEDLRSGRKPASRAIDPVKEWPSGQPLVEQPKAEDARLPH